MNDADPYQSAEAAIREAIRLEAIALDLRPSSVGAGQLPALPESIGDVTKLRWLNVGGNQLRTLPDSMARLSHLQELYLSENLLTTLPICITNLAALRELYASKNEISALPGRLRGLRSLEKLDLSSNRLSTLPESLGDLAEMRELNLKDNNLRQLPRSLGNLSNLGGLYVSHNWLEFLPESLGSLTRLPVLDVSCNRLTTLPESLGRLTQLRELDVRNNRLRTLPDSLGKLESLISLSAAENKLQALPESIGDLPQLSSLSAPQNVLSSVPESLTQIQSLRELDLSNNQLTTLPKSLGRLSQLTTLLLCGNQLSTLPESAGKLTGLAKLDVSTNKLTELPEALRGLTRLAAIYLHGNPSLGLPEEALGRTRNDYTGRSKDRPAAEILNSYFRIRGEAGWTLGECKLIVVGRGGAGKTSLIKRLGRERFDPAERETHGITIQPLTFNCERGLITARTWDFGGQIVLHSMHEFFLTERSLYLLVLGERDDMVERDAAYWLQLIRSYAGSAPVVVALNKSAGRQRRFDRATLEKNHGPILGWVATECSEENLAKGGISQLRQALTEALDSSHMDSVRSKFPAKWFAIKQELERMHECYLDYTEYAARCEAHGESDAREQAVLAANLHDLGIALNYGSDARLRDTTVLRPDWLANGIYAVLRANDLDSEHLPTHFNAPMAPGGIVTAESLSQIHAKAEAWGMLRAADYPTEKREFLLRLMNMFHLSYPLDIDGKQQLVPSLLPPDEPPGADEPDQPGSVRLRYEFQVVPAPLLPWFIARTFSLIVDRLHWRRGAFLTYGEARARVWTTQDERFVFATVAGPSDDRRELFTMIRGTFDDLFNGYRGLQVTEQWQHQDEWVPRKIMEAFGRFEPEVKGDVSLSSPDVAAKLGGDT